MARMIAPKFPLEDRAVLGWYPAENVLLNLHGDYDYLTAGYYISQDLESQGYPVAPTCLEILDGYVTPLMLEKARLAGIPVPSYYLTNGYFEPPVIVDPVNPFMSGHSIVLKRGHQERVARSMTRNSTYAICCQELPPGAQVRVFRAVLGWSGDKRYRELAAAIWRVFRIPVAVVRVVIGDDGRPLLSAMQPLTKLKAKERAYLNRVVTWPA